MLNNLKLNPAKSKGMLFKRRSQIVIFPPSLPGIERVDSMIGRSQLTTMAMTRESNWLVALLKTSGKLKQ